MFTTVYLLTSYYPSSFTCNKLSYGYTVLHIVEMLSVYDCVIDPFPIIGFYLYHVISADQSNNWTTSGI